jgi:hypothetical protein
VENYNNYVAGLPKTYYFVDAVCVSTNPLDCDELRPVSIEEISSTNMLVFPNPANTSIQVQSEFKITDLNIYDVSGKLLFKSNASPIDKELNISHLSKGLYILVVQFENGTEQNVSFIKQ